MTSGNDQPGQPDPNPDWWQGAPAPEPTWQQQPQQPPVYPSAPQSNPTWSQPGYQPTTPITGGQYGQPYQPPQYQPTQAFGAPPPGYGGQPPYPPPPGGGKRRVWLFAGLGALVVAIVAAVVIVALVNRNSSEPSAKSSTTPSLISALTSTTARPSGSDRPTPTKTSAAKPTSTPTAVIPGYQVVTIPDNGAAYDIPPAWKVDRTGQNAFGSGSDSIPVAGLAQDGVDYCPKNVRTNVFLTQSDETDPAKAAADIGTRLGRIGWSTATGTTAGAPESFQSADGQLQGIYLETKGNAQPSGAGCASTFSIYTFAFPGDNGAFVFTIAADTGVDQAVDAASAKKILASIRPIQ
ncbi:hypothetical protein GPX89_20045 [Nocardia sp. ET3-3]|uniref:DUF8017 domain-containing protein n=1 Tax=Nocardia terrae TaxID=2675851 RepID=A0A7K1UZ40_9NOCA|nr:hypothetical protein [Nocardia terrae]MVU79527.1 hypothetical protein [Nocardia terrae]